jgi:BlaI family transcriptional regulator, penicillinase repressor
MMARRMLPRPTDGELAILRVLWTQGASTVREVYDVLGRERPIGYTTALKLLQIMHEKGLVHRDESGRSHVYSAAASQEQTQSQLVGDLLERAFGGSARSLVQRALSDRKVSSKELAEIRKLLDQIERGEP